MSFSSWNAAFGAGYGRGGSLPNKAGQQQAIEFSVSNGTNSTDSRSKRLGKLLGRPEDALALYELLDQYEQTMLLAWTVDGRLDAFRLNPVVIKNLVSIAIGSDFTATDCSNVSMLWRRRALSCIGILLRPACPIFDGPLGQDLIEILLRAFEEIHDGFFLGNWSKIILHLLERPTADTLIASMCARPVILSSIVRKIACSLPPMPAETQSIGHVLHRLISLTSEHKKLLDYLSPLGSYIFEQILADDDYDCTQSLATWLKGLGPIEDHTVVFQILFGTPIVEELLTFYNVMERNHFWIEAVISIFSNLSSNGDSKLLYNAFIIGIDSFCRLISSQPKANLKTLAAIRFLKYSFLDDFSDRLEIFPIIIVCILLSTL